MKGIFVHTHSAKEIEGKLIDVQTEKAIVSVYEALGGRESKQV